MDIGFRTKRLYKIASDEKRFKREYGQQVAMVFYQRLSALREVRIVNDLLCLPGKHHPLHENRKGEWACSLTANYRLIYEITTDEKGALQAEIKEITINEIADYH